MFVAMQKSILLLQWYDPLQKFMIVKVSEFFIFILGKAFFILLLFYLLQLN